MLYRVCYADPPWRFQDDGTRLAPSYEGQQRNGTAVYQTMSLDDICAMRGWVRALMDVDSFLFLWAPNSMVLEGQAQRVAREWGYTPKQLVPWIKLDQSGKPRIGGGHYTRVVNEQLMICRRGLARVKVHNEPGVLLEQIGEHSRKPEEAYKKIERLCDGPYLELFARQRYPGWDAWGDQIDLVNHLS